jgi:hypothetical protein
VKWSVIPNTHHFTPIPLKEEFALQGLFLPLQPHARETLKNANETPFDANVFFNHQFWLG